MSSTGCDANAALSALLLDEMELLSPSTAQLLSHSTSFSSWSAGFDLAAAEKERTTVSLGPQPVAQTIAKLTEAPEPLARDGEVKKTRKRAVRPVSDMKANLRRSKHRDREKREIMFLRAHSHVLEQQMEQLTQSREERLRLEAERETIGEQQSSVSTGSWRALALIRRRGRKKAEQENARLRALWRMQLRFAAQMQQMSAVQRNLVPPSGYEARVTFGEADTEVFAALMDDLDVLFKHSRRILADTGLSTLPERRFNCVRRRNGKSQVEDAKDGLLDLIDVTLLQSDYDKLRENVWGNILNRFLARNGTRFQVTQHQGENTVTIKMRYQAEQKDQETAGGDMFFDVMLAIRKYPLAPDRELVVWKSLNTGDGALLGAVANETGYCVMHRSIARPEYTIMKRIRRLEPMEAPKAPPPPKVAEIRSCGGQDDTFEEAFSSLSLSAMEVDIDGTLRTIGYEDA